MSCPNNALMSRPVDQRKRHYRKIVELAGVARKIIAQYPHAVTIPRITAALDAERKAKHLVKHHGGVGVGQLLLTLC